MAGAIVTIANAGRYGADFTVDLHVAYGGDLPGEGGWNDADVRVQFPATADPDTIHAAMADAVVADGEAQGYTIDRAALTLPVFQKG